MTGLEDGMDLNPLDLYGHEQQGRTDDGEHTPHSLSIEFLEYGDFDTARAVIDIVHAHPDAYVSPYKHYDAEIEDGEPAFSDIFNKVDNEDYNIAVAKDESGEVVGTAMLSYDPNRSHIVTWYLVGLHPEKTGQNVGGQFLTQLAETTFNTPRHDDEQPQLILIEVILNDGNYNTKYSLETREQFPPMYRLCQDLSFVEPVGHLKDCIADPEEKGSYLPGAMFQIGITDYIAYTSNGHNSTNGNGR